MTFVQAILDFLRQFWPFEIVHSYQRAVRFWLGVDTALLEPGLYMFVPFFGSIEVLSVAPDIHRLENQNLTTRDGVSVLLSVNMRYVVIDARKAFCDVHDYETTLGNACRSALSSAVRRYEYPKLLRSQAALERRCLKAVNEHAAEWGLHVTSVNLADFVGTKSLTVAKI